MSQTPKFPVLKIRNKNPGTCSSGANSDITIDGKRYPLSFLKLEFHSRRVTKATMEMFVEVDAELEPGDVTLTVKKVSGWKQVLGELSARFFGK